MNEHIRIVVTPRMAEAIDKALRSSGLMGLAVTAGVTELRLLVQQAAYTKHPDLPKLQALLAVRSEEAEKHPEPELGALFVLPTK